MGVKERKQREKEFKKNMFLDVAEELFFENGYKETTMDMIAEKSEYSKGTLYLYFKSKEELLAHIYLRAMTEMHRMLREYSAKAENGLDKLYQFGRANFDFLKSHNKYYDLMNLFRSSNIDVEPIKDVIQEVQEIGKSIYEMMIASIIQGKKEGMIKEDLNEFTTTYLLAACSNGVFNFINQMDHAGQQLPNYNEEAMFDLYFEVIRHGIRK